MNTSARITHSLSPLLVALALAGSARADDPAAPPTEGPALLVPGEYQTPAVTTVMTRENLNKTLELARPERSVLPAIAAATAKAPF